MVDLGPGQGRSDFVTGGVAVATVEDYKEREHRPGPKDAVRGRTIEGISKLGFSVEIKARPRSNPQAYSSMSRT